MVNRKKKEPKKVPWPENFAKYSWMTVIISVLVPTCFSITQLSQPPSDDGSRFLPGVAYLVIAGSGVLAGVIALCAIPKFGKKRIMTPAIVGVVLHIALCMFLITSLQSAREAAQKLEEQRQQQQQDQQPPAN